MKLSAIISSLFLSIFLLLIPQPAWGWIFDKASVALEGVSAKTGPIMAVYLFALAFFVLGYIVLFISTFLLNGIIAATPIILTVTTGEASAFVRIGWDFTTGIVNLILIIAFIIIAFAIIIGSEKIGIKKTLPKLIVVALLVNFTLLFVGIGIDISNFLFNSIANQFFVETDEGGNLLFRSVTSLFEFSGDKIAAIFIKLSSIIITLALPYLNVAVQIGWILSLPTILTFVIEFLVYGGIMWMLSGVFFLFFLVFLIRVFIIQILAVLAPLAFFCLIFDETKQYWDQWRKALIEWLFVGVVFIFLMYFGLAMAPLVVSLADPFRALAGDQEGLMGQLTGWFVNGIANIIGYIALLAYFIVIVFIAKKFVPAAVSAVISQATNLAKMAAPWAGAIARGTGQGIRNWEAKKSEKNKNTPEPTGVFARAQRWTSNRATWAVRRAHHMAGTSVAAETEKDVKGKFNQFQESFGEEGQEAAIEAYNAKPDIMKTEAYEMAFLQYMSAGGAKVLGKLSVNQREKLIRLANQKGDPKTAKNAIKHMPDDGDIEKAEADELAATTPEEKRDAKEKLALARTVQNALGKDINEDEHVKSLGEDLKKWRDRLITATDATQRSEIENNIKIGEQKLKKACAVAVYKISAQSLKTEDIENLSGETLKNENFLKAITQTRDFNFIRLISGRKDGAEIMRKLNNTTSGISQAEWNELKRVNPHLCNQIKNSPGAQAMFSGIHARIKAETLI